MDKERRENVYNELQDAIQALVSARDAVPYEPEQLILAYLEQGRNHTGYAMALVRNTETRLQRTGPEGT